MLINYFILSTVLSLAMAKGLLRIHVDISLLINFSKNLSQFDLKLWCSVGMWIYYWLAGLTTESPLLLEISCRGSGGKGVCWRLYISMVNAIYSLAIFSREITSVKVMMKTVLMRMDVCIQF